MQVVAFVLFDVRPDAREAFIAAAAKVMRATQQESGCIVYHFGADMSESHRFQITEVWESQSALQAHHETAHAQAARAEMEPIATILSMKLWSAALIPIDPVSGTAEDAP